MKFKLLVGQVFKNYIKVCEWLGVKPTKGKGRDYHLREFERYCKYHIEGNKFIVDEVYNIPLEKIDNRGGNNNKYGTLMDDLIIDMLNNNGGIIEENFTNIFCEKIPLFSNDYKYENLINIDELAKNIFATKGLVNLYNSKKRDMVVGLFERSLNRLAKDNIIKWEKCFGVKINKTNSIVSEGDKLYQEIKDTKKELCAELGTNEFMLMKDTQKYKEFKQTVSDKLYITKFWSLYKIVLIQIVNKPPTDIDKLKELCIINLHKSLLEKEMANDFGEIYQPYRNKNESIQELDEKFWQGKKVIYTEIEKEIALENYEIDYDDIDDFPF